MYPLAFQFMERLQQLVDDMDRKIRRHTERMEEENTKDAQVWRCALEILFAKMKAVKRPNS
jgi:hypothetical protein